MTWLPIETLTWKAGRNRSLFTGKYEGHAWIEIGFRSRGSGRIKMNNGQTLLGITHWMPLPELPGEEAE